MVSNATPKAAVETPVPAIPAIRQPEPAVRPAAVEAKIAPALIPVTDTKTISSVAKSPQFNLKVEEVKIPAWLAPLARETESATQSSPAQDAASTSTSVESDAQVSAGDSSVATEEKSATSHSVVFGGQLLGGASSETQEAPSSGSKTGLILGLAAAAILVIGGVWYGLQPGNFLAGKSAAVQSNITNSPAAAIPVSTSGCFVNGKPDEFRADQFRSPSRPGHTSDRGYSTGERAGRATKQSYECASDS